MGKKNLDKALNQFEKDFGFSFHALIDKPDKYNERMRDMEARSQNKDTKHFSKIYDDSQMKLYLK